MAIPTFLVLTLLAAGAAPLSVGGAPAGTPASSLPSAPALPGASATPGSGEPLLSLDRPLDRAELVAAVLARNPDLEAARQAVAGAQAAEMAAGSRDLPVLSYGIAPGSLAGGTRFGQEVKLTQPWPWPGKRKLDGAIATARVEVERQQLEALRRELAEKASRLFDDYFQVGRELTITHEHLGILEDLKQVATSHYAAGLVPQSDPLAAEVEVAHLAHHEVELIARKNVLVVRLNALLHRLPLAPMPLPPDDLPVPPMGDLAIDRLADAALAARPELAAAQAEVEARSLALERAQLERRPDLAWMGSYSSMWDERGQRLMVGVEIGLPLVKDRLDAGIAAAQAELAAAVSRRESLLDQIRAEVAISALQLVETLHRLDLYASRLLPAARDGIRAALTAFRAGLGPAMAVLEAEHMLRDTETGYVETLAEHYRQRAEVERSLGRSLGPVGGTGGHGMAGLDPTPPPPGSPP